MIITPRNNYSIGKVTIGRKHTDSRDKTIVTAKNKSFSITTVFPTDTTNYIS